MKLLLSILTSIGFLITFTLFLFYVPDIEATGMTIVSGAHRGNSINYTENSVLAIYDATINPKYDFVEFDVQYTKDMVPVVFHDYTLTRLHKIPFTVSSLTYDQLKELSHNTIPTFEEVMSIIGNRKDINIEIKPVDDKLDIQLTDYTIKYCEDHGIKQNIILSSISKDVVRYVSENHPEIPTGLIYFVHPVTYLHFDSLVLDLYKEVDEVGADYLMMHGVNVRDKKLFELKPDNITLVFWYFTDEMIIIEDYDDVIW